ncbi:MAG TPA: hypothetical protein VI814_03740 [Candidatus Limnocylindria bacterium]
MGRGKTLRVIAVIGLLSAAFFAVLPWLGCMAAARGLGIVPGLRTMLGPCTYLAFRTIPGQDVGIPGFSYPPYWGYLVVGVAYLVAAVYVAVNKRF